MTRGRDVNTLKARRLGIETLDEPVALRDAGIVLYARVADSIEAGQPLMTLHVHPPAWLDYALDFDRAHRDMIQVTP